MKRELELELMRRVFKHVETRQTDMVENTHQIPVEVYTCKERFQKEQDTLFRKFPLVVGFSSQVASPGDFITHDLTGVPILVCRTKGGGLSAFINACRHRGARLTHEPCGHVKRNFVCPFHAWGFSATDGKLRSLPRAMGFPDLDKDKYGLTRLAVAERYGLIFVVPTPGIDFDIDEFLGILPKDLDTLGYNNHAVYKPGFHPKKMNWKFHMDTNSETYHFRALHQGTAGEVYLRDVAVVDYDRPHARFVAPQHSILEMANLDEDKWKLIGNTGILYTIFPNTLYFTSAGFAHILSIYPQDVDHATFQSGMLVPNEPHTPQNLQFWDLHFENYWQTMVQDIFISESMHSTMRSGAQSEIIFGRYEYIAAEFEKAVQAAIDGEFTLESMMKKKKE